MLHEYYHVRTDGHDTYFLLVGILSMRFWKNTDAAKKAASEHNTQARLAKVQAVAQFSEHDTHARLAQAQAEKLPRSTILKLEK